MAKTKNIFLILLELKWQEICIFVKDEWLFLLIYAMVILGSILSTIFPVIGVIGVYICEVVAVLFASGLILMFFGWLKRNYRKAKKIAVERLADGQ